MSPVSRSSAVGARVQRRTKGRGASSVADADYVDPWDLENELYVKRLSVVGDPGPLPAPPEPKKASSRRTSNCYYDIAGFEEADFQNERLYSYEGGDELGLDGECWMQSAYGDYCYYDDDFDYGGVDPGYDAGYHRYKPVTCFPCPDGLHTYEECAQRQTIYSDDYYIPMSSGSFYPYGSAVGYQLYSPTRRSLASNQGSQHLKRVYETRKTRMALPAEDAGFYEKDYYGSWQRWKDGTDNQRMSVLSGYYSDEIPGDLTDDSLGGGGDGVGPGGPGSPYADPRGPPPPIPASHFGLTKHGHLKIDYSCNWSSLDRFIGHQNKMAVDGRGGGGGHYAYKAPSSNHVY